MTVEMPSIEGDVNRIVDLFCCFGDTEIKVKAVDHTSGSKCKTSLRFYIVISLYIKFLGG